MDGRLRQLRESVIKASAPKLNQRQPPGVMSQTPTHSSLKDAVWHSPPMTRQPSTVSLLARSPSLRQCKCITSCPRRLASFVDTLQY